jgi:sec-independent protein translocase protein TatA
MPGWIGPWEIAILLVIVLLVFGPKRLPEMGKSLGRGMREFKNSVTGKDDDDYDDGSGRGNRLGLDEDRRVRR